MIFRRDKKRRRDAEDEATAADTAETTDADGAEPDDDTVDEPDGAATADELEAAVDAQLLALDEGSWRDSGPWDITEVDGVDDAEEGPRIDLGSLVITGVPGSELRLRVDEESGQLLSAMLVIETAVEASATERTTAETGVQVYNSALDLGALAAPRSGGLWSELRDEMAASTVEAGGTASLAEGPFGVELRCLVPVTTPDGSEGYQPSRTWAAEGPRWLLRGTVYGQAAVEEDPDSPVVADLVAAFRHVVVRRGEDAMAPADLLPLHMPEGLNQTVAEDTEDEPA